VGRLSFDEWGDRLCARFFLPENSSRPVTLFVDDEVLAQVAGTDEDEAVSDLTAAVRSRMGPGTQNMFYAVLRDASIWKSAGGVGCPPFLPLLALGVLAAAHMAREGDVAAHNYYRRFRDLVGLDGSGMPRGYDESFPTLWNWLTWWLNEVKDGSLGVSTVHAHSWLTNIGYALSQALFRESDRQRMTHFFYWLDLEPGERLSEQELLQYFRVWARKYRRVGDGVLRMVEDPRYDTQLLQVLLSEAEAWDGVLRDDAGRRYGVIHLTLDVFPRPVLGLAAESPEGFPAETEFGTNGARMSLRRVVPGWYGDLPLQVTDEILRNGLQLASGRQALSYTADEVVPFRQEPVLGKWASVRKVKPGDAHWVLVHKNRESDVVTLLERYATEGWSGRPMAGFTDWMLVSGVVIDRPLETEPPPGLDRLVPTVRERPALQGGLPLPRGLYLRGGEPDVWVPPAEGEERRVLLGSTSWRIGPEGGSVSVRKLALPEGRYEVEIPPSRLAFVTMESCRALKAPDTGTLAFRLRRDDQGEWVGGSGARPRDGDRPSEEGAVVCGTEVLAPGSELETAAPILLPIGASKYVVAGAKPGEVLLPTEPRKPAWMRRVNMQPRSFEVDPPFVVVWVLVQWSHRGWVARTRNSTPPSMGTNGHEGPDLANWIAIFKNLDPRLEGDAAALWATYRRAASEVRTT
jgi:hypothetical protein